MRYLLFLGLLVLPLHVFALDRGPILVLGDSLSAAYRIAPESGWVALLDTRLKHDAHLSRPVINASISGETSYEGRMRLPALLAEHHPALVLVELGANDALRGLPIEAARDNLENIITLSQASGAKVLLIGIEIPVNYGTRYRDGLRTMYRDLSAQFKLPLLPFLLEGVALDPELMQDDGLHPRAVAEPRVLENVWTVLKPVLEAMAQK